MSVSSHLLRSVWGSLSGTLLRLLLGETPLECVSEHVKRNLLGDFYQEVKQNVDRNVFPGINWEIYSQIIQENTGKSLGKGIG